LFIGLTSGAYSSIFNATPILVSWHNGELAAFFGRKSAKKAEAAN
jgi:preprotein translocase subunit SecF